MRKLRALFLRLGGLFNRWRRAAEFDDEMESNLQMQIEDNLRAGMSPEEARYAALRKFGNVTRVKEDAWGLWSFVWLEQLWQDIPFGVRMLAKSPGFTSVVIVTVALGIGVNTAIFSVMNGWLLRPLPVPSPEQIVVVAFSAQQSGSNMSYPDLRDFQKQADAFSGLFGYAYGGAALSTGGMANEFSYTAVTGNYFSSLGVKPLLGRLLSPGEGEKPGEGLLLVLGYSFWQRRFGGDAAIIGRQVLINGKPATIVGVAPREFHGTFFGVDINGYLSLNALPLIRGSSGFWTDRRDRELTVLGRLKPGVSPSSSRNRRI